MSVKEAENGHIEHMACIAAKKEAKDQRHQQKYLELQICQQALQLQAQPSPLTGVPSQNFGESDGLGLDLGSYSASQPYADPFTGPQLGESALH